MTQPLNNPATVAACDIKLLFKQIRKKRIDSADGLALVNRSLRLCVCIELIDDSLHVRWTCVDVHGCV